jgi:serine/threonine protein kinase
MKTSLRTPNFIHIGQLADDREFVVMELLGGEDMASVRSRIRASPATPSFSGGMSMQLAAYFAMEMLSCIQELHEHGLIHR